MTGLCFKIGKRQVGGKEIFFVVEEGQANQGNFKKALLMIDAAAMSGADAIEFQLARAGDFYIRSDQGYRIYLKREFKNEQIKRLIEYTKSKRMEFIAVPLSHRLIEPLAKAGCSAFNINASDLTNPDIIDAVAASGMPFFLSLLLATQKEIDWAIKRMKKNKALNYALLHGQHVMASGKPGVDPEHTALGFISTLKKKYRLPVGFVDHTSLNWFPAAAAAAGADIISRHIILSHKDRGPDWQVCLDPRQMREAIGWARKMRKSIILGSKNLSPGEDMDKLLMRRSIVAARDLKQGRVIQRQDICFKRPGTGICPSRFEEIMGRKLIRAIKDDRQIKHSDLEVK
ncbi:MAG: N-acetylneuraminate synthase family protein [Candidatus Omnitrophica bacterium]|nr:N-acetylneuraminate synthase family protein [Candidatus Omnitrophota bacterium]